MGHLSPLRFGCAAKLRSKYMDAGTGGGIPAALAADWAGARTRAELAALQLVLDEFFVLKDGVYRRAEFDQIIQQYMSKSQKARSSAAARWSHSERNADAMLIQESKNPRIQKGHTQHPPAVVCVGPEIEAMRTAGIKDAPDSDSRVNALVRKGVQPEQFAGAARIAVSQGKGFAYAIGVIKQQLKDAASVAEVPSASSTARPAPPPLPPAVGLTAEQLKANGARAREVAAHLGLPVKAGGSTCLAE
jgi:uncharacterized protein YdaU (DUF1376 family)